MRWGIRERRAAIGTKLLRMRLRLMRLLKRMRVMRVVIMLLLLVVKVLLVMLLLLLLLLLLLMMLGRIHDAARVGALSSFLPRLSSNTISRVRPPI